MAKRTKTPISPEAKAMTERVGALLMQKLKELDDIYAVEGVHTRPVKKEGEGYKQKPITPGSEFVLNDFYLGAKGQLIFKCVPVETQLFDWAEVDDASMDNVFPLVGASLAEALDITDCEDFVEIVNALKARLQRQDEEAALAALDEKKEADKAYESNPLFGRF